MKFTDLFIRRPVLAMSVSLLLLALGLRSLYSLPVNQFPHTENAVVTIAATIRPPTSTCGTSGSPARNAGSCP